MMNIAIIGVGYVGLVTGACFAQLGNNVICIDNDEKKIEMLRNCRIPYFEPELDKLVQTNVSQGRLSFTTQLEKSITACEVIFIAVGTPQQHNNNPDMHYINDVISEIIPVIDEKKYIVIKSTIPLGSTRKIKQEIESELKKRGNVSSIEVAFNPEFLSEGTAVNDFMHPDRIVIGVDSLPIRQKLTSLYEKFKLDNIPILITNYESAEMIKYASNAFLATKISYINEIALICEHYGANIKDVASGMGMDKRIGSSFLNAGAGYGGSCFPKDTKALINIGKDIGYEPKIVKEAVKVNEDRKNIIISKIKKILRNLEGKTVAILGVAFKPNTDDIREAPAAPVVKYLINNKVNVNIYDPSAMENFKKDHEKAVYCENAYEACTGCDCIIIFTEWSEFTNLDFERLKSIVYNPVILDLRNMLDETRIIECGFQYIGVGIPINKN